MANMDESMEGTEGQQTFGLIRNRRAAFFALFLILILLGSDIRTIILRVPHRLWLIEPPHQLSQLRSAFVGLDVFFWVFALWILFWCYRAARHKYERFLVAGAGISLVLSAGEAFLPSLAAANAQLVSCASLSISFAAALRLVFMLPSN